MLPVLSKLVKSYRVLDLSKSGWGCDCIKNRYFSEMCLRLSALSLYPGAGSALLRQQHGLLFRNMNCIKAGGSCAPDVCSLGRAGVLHIQRCSVSGGRLGSAACCAIPELVGLEGTSAHHPVPPSSQHVQVALECLQRGRLPDALGCLFHWSVERRSSSCWGGTSSRFTSPAQLFPTCFQSKRQECWWKTPGP